MRFRWSVIWLLPLLSIACAPRGPEALRLATWGSLQEIAVLRTWLDDRRRAHPDDPVELIHIPDAYFQKLPILRAAGRFPDVLFLNSWYLPAFARAGALLPLERLPGLNREAHPPAALAALSWQDHLHALPRDVSNLVVYVNLEAFAARGLPLPGRDWSLATYLTTARMLAHDGPDGRRLFGAAADPRPIFWFPLLQAAGLSWWKPGDRETRLADPGALETLEALQGLRQEGVAPDERSAGRTPAGQLFVEGRLGMWISGRWSIPSLRERAPFRWDVWPLPGGIRVADASGWAIARDTRFPDRAWQLVRDLTGRDLVERHAASGLIVPARHDVSRRLAELDRGQLPAHASLFIESLQGARPTALPPSWPRTSIALERALDPLWSGRRAAREVLPEAARRVAESLGDPS
jgi:multiple sugar transport system substrate-binding protein